MLNQLKLIPDSVIRNTKKGAQFQRPKHACNFVNSMLRMAGLIIQSQQIRTGEVDPETDKEKRIRRYSIHPDSLVLMQHYASRRAAHRQIGLSHIGINKLQAQNSVTSTEPAYCTTTEGKSVIAVKRIIPVVLKYNIDLLQGLSVTNAPKYEKIPPI